jgi:hypothetical protein
VGRDLQLLNDLAQLAAGVEQAEHAGGEPTFGQRRGRIADRPLQLQGGDLLWLEQPAAGRAHRV